MEFQSFSPSCLDLCCHTRIGKFLRSFQVDGVDNLQRGDHDKACGFLREGAGIHLHFQELGKKVVHPIRWGVEVAQLFDPSTTEWHCWCGRLRGVDPQHIAAADVRSVCCKSNTCLLQRVRVLLQEMYHQKKKLRKIIIYKHLQR